MTRTKTWTCRIVTSIILGLATLFFSIMQMGTANWQASSCCRYVVDRKYASFILLPKIVGVKAVTDTSLLRASFGTVEADGAAGQLSQVVYTVPNTYYNISFAVRRMKDPKHEVNGICKQVTDLYMRSLCGIGLW